MENIGDSSLENNDTVHKKQELAENVLQVLLDAGKLLTSELELEQLVQRITDIGTSLSGAEFGAFFYNVVNNAGESYVLYIISGVPREAFSKFPMPRNTKIFAPTFGGKGTVRYDDVTQQSHYGQNTPYHGMPKGHLPVRSYLAVPVTSAVTGEVLGGLFFGHSKTGMFTETSERLIEGIAAQAAIAMGNARLFEDRKRIEKALTEQKEQLQAIFDATFDAVLVYDENGFIVEANPAACRMHGYGYNELIGLHGTTLMKESPDLLKGIQEITFSGRKYTGAGIHLKKDGTVIEAEMTGIAFFFRGKKHLQLAVRDITGTKNAEKALQKTEVFADIMLAASPAALWMTDETGQIVYVNPTWTDWTGGDLQRHLGNGWLSYISEKDRPTVWQNFRDAFEQRKIFTTDFRIVRHNGETRWCTATLRPYFHSNGIFAGYAGSCNDITERKKAEESLEHQNALINTITNNAYQGLYLLNSKGYCTYINPAASSLCGYSLEELAAKPFHYYIHHTRPDGSHYPMEECPVCNALLTGKQAQGEETYLNRNNHFFPVAYIASPILHQGIVNGLVVEMRDITEEKRLRDQLNKKESQVKEELEDKVRERTREVEASNYELTQFTSVASHDLKEPLRKITVFGKLLRDAGGNLPPETTGKYVNNIINSSTRMSALINDLLAFSGTSADNVTHTAVNLNVVINKIISDLEISIREKNATIAFESLPIIQGAETQLRQVFQNLISNSLKFSSPDRPPYIRVMAKEEANWYHLEYTDNGIGFSNEHAGKIFEVFQRLHSKDQYEGTGIGLAIVKKVITMHGGTITAESEENIGTRFSIRLPKTPTTH